ncbi:carboxypeptidase-like regulatory domain-containing protein [Tunturiibacter empetritectus]|uniref:carboxypeptidase-like regulatory domain-containing protein n=1 Tax=Tunturiibacter empetritectus TaxID=3069691 RepID=UPI003D9B7CD0
MSLKYFRYFAPAALIFASGILQAQTSKGILSGVVRDSTGAVVSGAEVIVTNQDTHEIRNTISRNDGAYSLEALTPGRYSVQMKHSGFKTVETNDLVVNASIVTSFDATFTVGGVSDTVQVEAVNSGINTENGQARGRDLDTSTSGPAHLYSQSR